MPDFERPLRSLQLHLTEDDPIERARLEGRFEGQDTARKQIVVIFLALGLLYILYQIATTASP